jgi:hypothetical protein
MPLVGNCLDLLASDPDSNPETCNVLCSHNILFFPLQDNHWTEFQAATTPEKRQPQAILLDHRHDHVTCG